MAELTEEIEQRPMPPEPAQPRRRVPTDAILMIAFAVAAAALFSVRAGAKSLWLDEGVSWGIAQLPWSGFWHTLASREANMGLYYLLLRGWLHLFDSEAGIRAISVVAAAGTFPFAYALCRSLFGRRAAIVSCALLLVNGFFLSELQQARGYALVVLLVTAASFFLARYVRDKKRTDLIAYAVLGVLSVYAHFFGAFVLVGHALSLIPLLRRRLDWRPVAFAYAGIAVGVAPLALAIASNNVGQVNWISPLTPLGFERGLSTLLGGAGPKLPIIYGVLLVAVAAMAVRPSLRLPEMSQDTWPYLFVLLWAVVPIAASLIVSLVAQPIFLRRYLVVSLPAFAISGGIGIALLRFRVLVVAGAVLMLALARPNVVRFVHARDHENWRDPTAYVLSHAQKGDAVVFYAPFVHWPFDYYVHRSGGQNPLIMVYPPGSWLVFGPYRTTPPPPDDIVQQLASRFDRVWLIISHNKGRTRELQRQLREVYTEQARSYRGVRVYFYELTSPPSPSG